MSETNDANDEPATDFDFLLGEWRTRAVDAAGIERNGRWRAEKRAGGHIVVDEYEVHDDDGGWSAGFVTLRTWCDARQRWEMTYLPAGAPTPVAEFHGERVGAELHLCAIPRAELALGIAEARVRFGEIEADGFRWEQEVRRDAEGSWQPTLSITARRVR